MLAWGLMLMLAVAGPAQAQSLTELFVQSERARLVTLKDELKTLSEREPKTAADRSRLSELRLEIRRIEGRVKAIEEDEKRRHEQSE